MIPTHPHALRLSMLLTLLGWTVASASITHAALFTIPETPPKTIDDVRQMVSRKNPAKPGSVDGPIVQTLMDGGQCGGVSANEEVNAGGKTKIPLITGVPGRRGDPLGNITSGLAKRDEAGGELDNGFQFPAGTQGYTTACLPDKDPTTTRTTTWGFVINDIPYPQLHDPACKYYKDVTENGMTADTCHVAFDYFNESQFGYWDCRSAVVETPFGPVCLDGGPGNAYGVYGLTWRYVCSDGWADQPKSQNALACSGGECRCDANVSSCRKAVNGNPYQSFFRKYNGESVRAKIDDVSSDLLATSDPSAKKANCSNEQNAYAQAVARYQTATQRVDQLEHDTAADVAELKQVEASLKTLAYILSNAQDFLTHPEDYKRDDPTLTLDDRKAELEKIIDETQKKIDALNAKRTDLGNKLRGPLNDLIAARAELMAAEQKMNDAEKALRTCVYGEPIELPVQCYGFYREYDPKTELTTKNDKRCVINFPYSHEQLRDSQKGRGDFLSPATDIPYSPRDTDFKPADDVWYQNLGGAMSLLTKDGFQKKYGSDLTQALLSLDDTAQIKASNQNANGDPLTKTSLVRAFDDTVSVSKNTDESRRDARSFTQWWQQLDTGMTTLLTPPRVRLRLPDTGALAFSTIRSETGVTIISRDARTQSIEVQLNVDDDLLGRVAGFLQQSLLLRLQEEPIPVVVPLGTPEGFRKLRDRWCEWSLREHDRTSDGEKADCKDVAPQKVKDLMDRLDEYAVQIENVRSLRNQLPKAIGSIVEHQNVILDRIGAWIVSNLSTYKQYVAQRQIRLQFQQAWKSVEQEANRFNGDTNQPWCRNDRFTLPVYSLLDPWFPRPNGRLDGGNSGCRTADGLPMICAPAEEDLVFDFSKLKVTGGSVKFPVLKPQYVDIKLPTPPGVGETLDESALDLPAFQPIANLVNAVPAIPDAIVKEPLAPLIPAPKAFNTIDAFSAMRRAYLLLNAMNTAYKEFWDSLEPNDDTRALRCPDWGEQPCTQSEMDLIERFTRIMARPAVLLKEDLQSVGVGRLPAGDGDTSPRTLHCDPSDEACLNLLPERTAPSNGWQIIPAGTPLSSPDIDRLRDTARTLTIDNNGMVTFPYEASFQSLYGIFTVPNPIQLSPTNR